MPGLIGFAGRPGSEDANKTFLGDMARALEPEALFRVDSYHDQDFGLGRVTLGIINGEPQPLWNEERTLCVMMEGELYDTQRLKQDLAARGYRFQSQGDAELILHLFEAHGEQFAVQLNGIFVAAIWDQHARKLTVVNDRLGLHPLYYARRGDSLLLASGVRALLADPALPRCVDKVAVAQFLTFDHPLHQRTLLHDAHLLPQASVLTYQDGKLAIRSYWSPQHPERYALRPEEEWMYALHHYLKQAVTRQAGNGVPLGMLLSGGLDSRALLALLREKDSATPFHTFSWGIPGCDDARYAREVAAKLGTEHHFFELRPGWLRDFADECVRVTDGMGNITNLHARATLDEEASHARVLYKGFLGDAMMGFAQRHQHWADYDEDTQVEAHLEVHRAQGVITFDPTRYGEVFAEEFQREIGSAVLDSYRSGMKESGSSLLADQRIYFDYCQRVPRHTLNGVLVVRSRAAVRLPFADNDLVDLMLQVPPGLRMDRALMRNTFIREFPALAQIPVPNTGLPMSDCARDVVLRAQQLVRWHLNNAGLKRVAYPGRRPYKDYNGWFRTVLRDWVEELLLDRRALERGYVRPETMRQLVQEHMNGANHAVRLGAMLTLELWHRQFVD